MSELGGPLESSPEARASTGDGLLGLVEERVAALVARHREAGRVIEELRSTLAERDARLADLAHQADAAEKLRAELRERVARLIQQVEQLERAPAGDSPG